MSAAFKDRPFASDIILLCIRWYCRYALGYRDHSVISTEKNPAFNEVIAALRREGRLAPHCRHRQVMRLNNRLESDHGRPKRLIRPVRGFQSQKTARNAIRGFDTMRMFRKGQPARLPSSAMI